MRYILFMNFQGGHVWTTNYGQTQCFGKGLFWLIC